MHLIWQRIILKRITEYHIYNVLKDASIGTTKMSKQQKLSSEFENADHNVRREAANLNEDTEHGIKNKKKDKFPPVLNGYLVHADWLKKYLVSLRLSKRSKPCPWNEWLGQKLLHSKSKHVEKPKDFRRALAGICLSYA